MKLASFYQNLPMGTMVQFRYPDGPISIRKIVISLPDRLEFETITGTAIGLVTEITPQDIQVETHGSWYVFYYKQRILCYVRVLSQYEITNMDKLASFDVLAYDKQSDPYRGYPSVRSFSKSHLTLVK